MKDKRHKTTNMFSKTDIEKYFLAEKQLGLALAVIGGIAIVAAIVFLIAVKTGFYKGAAIPLIVIGLFQVIVGAKTYTATDDHRVKTVYAFDMNPNQIATEELPRVNAQLLGFSRVKWAEIVLIAGGLALVFYFRSKPDKSFWYGLGVLLAIQAVITLLFDYNAERRTVAYQKGLTDLVSRKGR